MMRVRLFRLSVVLLFALLAASHVRAAGLPFQPTERRIAELSAMLPAAPRGVGAKCSDRAAWQVLAALPQFQQTVKDAEKLLAVPIEEMTDELYLDFSRTGNRRRGEKVIFSHSARLQTLVLAECCEDHGRFVAAIEEALRAICAEKTWVMPAHDGNLENFHGTNVTIDLRAAAVGWELATARYWLGEKLSPATRELIGTELERRIFTPFTGMITAGKPGMRWIIADNNWNAVCLAGVVGAALTAVESPQRRAFFVGAMEKSIPNFLGGFTPDGYCSEGVGYWNYGFGHYVLLAEMVHQATGGKLDMMADERVRTIASYGRRIEILPGVCPAFADCAIRSQPSPELMAFLSRRYGWGLADMEAKHFGPQHIHPSSLNVVGIYGFANSAAAVPPVERRGATPPRDWFSNAGVLVCRSAPDAPRTFGAAMKGGHNAENHNHNDLGSFVVALGKAVPLLDPGNEVYTKRTFSDRRYESKLLNSFGHPVPLVAGKLQRAGRLAAAKVVKTEFTPEADTLALDLSAAYKAPGLKALRRTFIFSRTGAGKLTVIDEVEFDRPQAFGSALVTYDSWKQRDAAHLTVGELPDAVEVEIAADGGEVRVAAEEIHEDTPDGRFPTRIGIDFTVPVAKAKLTLMIAPQ
jgi:hypothetical protein